MPVSLFIAVRYLFSKKKRNAVNVISWLAISVVAIATAALIIVFSVFNGFNNLFYSIQSHYDPALKISPPEGKTFFVNDSTLRILSSIEGINAVSCVLEENALFKYKDQRTISILKGVDDNYSKVIQTDSIMWSGIFDISSGKQRYVVLDAYIADIIGVNTSFPVFFNVLIPNRFTTTVNNPEEAFNIGDIYPVGTLYPVNDNIGEKFVIANIDFVRELTGRNKNEVSSIEVGFKKNADEAIIREKILKYLGKDISIKNQREQHLSIYNVMESEKWIAFFILTFIIIIASFSIISSITMLLIEKKDDIYTFKSFGASQFFIKKIFVLTGTMISIIGSLIGLSLGALLTIIQEKLKIISFPDGDTLIIDAYPVQFLFSDFLICLISVVFIGLITATIPVISNNKRIFSR